MFAIIDESNPNALMNNPIKSKELVFNKIIEK